MEAMILNLSRAAILHFLFSTHIDPLKKYIHTETHNFTHTFRSVTERTPISTIHTSLLKNAAEIINLLLDKLSLSSRDYGQNGVRNLKKKQTQNTPSHLAGYTLSSSKSRVTFPANQQCVYLDKPKSCCSITLHSLCLAKCNCF